LKAFDGYLYRHRRIPTIRPDNRYVEPENTSFTAKTLFLVLLVFDFFLTGVPSAMAFGQPRDVGAAAAGCERSRYVGIVRLGAQPGLAPLA
jgi:hypothetical protein